MIKFDYPFITKLKQAFFQITTLKDLVGFIFAAVYFVEVKLLYYITEVRIFYFGFFLYCMFCFCPNLPARLVVVQGFALLILFYLGATAITNYVFAKIPLTRRVIDRNLGGTFVSYHGINMLPRQAAKCAGAVAAGYALVTADALVTPHVNGNALDKECIHSVAQGLPKPSPARVQEIMDRPSALQTALGEAGSVIKDKIFKDN